MKQMAVRHFLRGGYQTITEPTQVSSHSRLLFVVVPSVSAGQWLEAMLAKTASKPGDPVFDDKKA